MPGDDAMRVAGGVPFPAGALPQNQASKRTDTAASSESAWKQSRDRNQQEGVTMRNGFGVSIVATASMCLLTSMAAAQFPPITDPNAAEAKCETGAGKA